MSRPPLTRWHHPLDPPNSLFLSISVFSSGSLTSFYSSAPALCPSASRRWRKAAQRGMLMEAMARGRGRRRAGMKEVTTRTTLIAPPGGRFRQYLQVFLALQLPHRKNRFQDAFLVLVTIIFANLNIPIIEKVKQK